MLKNSLHIYGPENLVLPSKLNSGDFIVKKLWEFKERPILINGITEEIFTYKQILQESMNVAVSLTRIGVKRGQVVGIYTENRREYWGSVVGTICAGGTVTAINPGYTEGELKHVLNISKPNYLFCSPNVYKKNVKTIQSLEYIKKIIVYGDEVPNNLISYNDIAIPKGNDLDSKNNGHNTKYIETKTVNDNVAINANNSLKNNGTKVVNVANNRFGNNSTETVADNDARNVADNVLERNVTFEEFEVADVIGQVDVVIILYSSGTTGLPKGVMITHSNFLAAVLTPPSLDPSLLALSVTPWYHSMGLTHVLGGMAVGKTTIYLPKFEIDLYLKTIEKYKIQQMTVVPPIVVAMCKYNSPYDPTSLRVVYCGAGSLRPSTIDTLKTKFPNLRGVIQGLGMTETTQAIIRGVHQDVEKYKAGSLGVVVPGCVVKVVDIDTRQPLGPNKSGEICVKGAIVMKGYIGTSSDVFDNEGFYQTGDVGYYDDDKHFYIVDRLKEMIKYKGFQVPPVEVEAIILQHSSVADAGVVGLPDLDAGELPLAFVVKQPGKNVTEEELKAFVAERLSNPKHLRGGVRFVPEIPKNPSGKIIRRTLRSMINSTKSKL